MTKAEIVKQIAGQMGLESKMVAGVVEALLERIRAAQIGGQNVYFRGFGSFVRRERAAKKARDISRNRPFTSDVMSWKCNSSHSKALTTRLLCSFVMSDEFLRKIF